MLVNSATEKPRGFLKNKPKRSLRPNKFRKYGVKETETGICTAGLLGAFNMWMCIVTCQRRCLRVKLGPCVPDMSQCPVHSRLLSIWLMTFFEICRSPSWLTYEKRLA